MITRHICSWQLSAKMSRFLLSSLQSTLNSCSSSAAAITVISLLLCHCDHVSYCYLQSSKQLILKVDHLNQTNMWVPKIDVYPEKHHPEKHHQELIGWQDVSFRIDPWMQVGFWWESQFFNKKFNRKQKLLLLDSKASSWMIPQVVAVQYMCNIYSCATNETWYSSCWDLGDITSYPIHNL